MARDRRPRDADATGAVNQRRLRVGEEVRHAIGALLLRGELRDPDLQGVSITVTEVRMSPDLRNATAFVLPLGGRNVAGVVAALGRAAPWIRGQVARLVRLRFVPEIAFRADTSFETAARIEATLREPEVAADLGRAEDGDDAS